MGICGQGHYDQGHYDRSRSVAGLGFQAGTIRFELATSIDPQKRVALSLIFGGC